MSKDRIIQLAAVGVAVACLGISMTLIPVINSQRLDLQLGFNAEVGDRVPPKYVLLAASLGSFRGVAANILWYRAEMMKREGKFFELNNLSYWITALQPRFPRVWAFMAWNMAYNISVETDTPQERWHWVNQGVRILREEGIVHNPRAVVLYRELGWIFSHKIGQYSDDMHWYYKEQLAREWQEVLGSPTDGATHEQALARFEPIAAAAETYFVFNRPSRQMYKILDSILQQEQDNPDIQILVKDLQHANIHRLDRSLDKLEQLLSESHGPVRAREQVRPLREAVDEHREKIGVDPLVMLYEKHPGTRPLVQQLRALDVQLDRSGLRDVGSLLMLIDYIGQEMVAARAEQVLPEREQKLFQLITNPEHADALRPLLAFWRAKVLLQDYHMDPGFMFILMERYGPLDWRHPATHAIYWSALGVETSMRVLDRAKIDILNTERQVIHGMQALMYSGRISMDPMTGRITTLPDPRFIKAYEQAMRDAVDRYEQVDFRGSGTIQSFESGHENFLQKAVVYSYLYGDEEQAREYYLRLRELYGDKARAQRDQRYSYSLQDFVLRNLRDELFGESVNTYQFIDAMIRRGFMVGLGNDRRDVFNRFINIAESIQQQYQQKSAYVNPNARQERERLLWGSFDDILNSAFISLMRSPQMPLVQRARIYRNAPTELKLNTYARIRAPLQEQTNAAGVQMEQLFPPPAGFEETVDIEKQLEGVDDESPGTVEMK